MKRSHIYKKRLVVLLALSFIIQFMPLSYNRVQAAPELKLNAASAILIDAATGQVLYENNADQPYQPASMAKMMTEYILMEKIEDGTLSLDDMVTTSHYAANVGGSGGLLAENEQLSVRDMLYAISIYSSNDASVAIAERISGSEAAFANLMNETAKELGLSDTVRFTSSTGLARSDIDDPQLQNNPLEGEPLISARDLAKLAKALITKHPDVLEYSKIPSKKLRESDQEPMTNWNWMLEGKADSTFQKQFAYPGMDGLKTGHTDAAGYCFTGTATRNGIRLISVVMNTTAEGIASPTKSQREASRFIETKKLLDYGFDNFKEKVVVEKNSVYEEIQTLPVKKGLKKSVGIEIADEVKMLMDNSAKDTDVTQSAVTVEPSKMIAPIKKGDELGTVTVKYMGIEKTTKLVATEDVKKAGWFRLFFRGVGEFFSGLGGKVKNLF